MYAKVSLISIFVWGIASLAAALAPSVLLFFAARLLLGIGEAPTFPASAKAVGGWFPAYERSFATTAACSTAQRELANAVGVPLLGLLLLQFGWRWSFGFTALLSFAYLAVFALVYREPHRFSIRNIVRRDSGGRRLRTYACASHSPEPSAARAQGAGSSDRFRRLQLRVFTCY